MLGRLTGGIATSLLFSVFEAWLVATHTASSYSQESLYQTFAWSTFLNGFAAILSGICFLGDGVWR